MKIGDVVYLKSGSAAMTVTNITQDGGIQLSWSTGSNLATTNLPEAALIADDPTPQIEATRQVATDAAITSAKETAVSAVKLG